MIAASGKLSLLDRILEVPRSLMYHKYQHFLNFTTEIKRERTPSADLFSDDEHA